MKTLWLLAPLLLVSSACATVAPSPHTDSAPTRPFGTLREQAERQHVWLRERLEKALPTLMRQYGVEMWVVSMREYNEDPVFPALVGPTTFAARRRTVYVFHDRGADKGVERLTLGGHSWLVLKDVLEERQPRVIALDVSRTTAFADGLTHGEYEAMAEALGPEWMARTRPAEGLAVYMLGWRGEDETRFYADLTTLAWEVIGTAFSHQVILPGQTRTADVVWWMRQRLNDLGLGTWFQPSVSVQRRGQTEKDLGDNPVIERGDVLHCDFGITALRLNTDTQHMGYVLREGETEAPAGLRAALARSNRLQDIVVEELRPGRSGNDILRSSLERMRAEGLDGSVYSHPIGLNGHGAGPMIGLWDRQEGVPGPGDHRVMPSQWFSIELQVTSPVPEWDGQKVRSAQEEDVVLDAQGQVRWALRRQTTFHLVREPSDARKSGSARPSSR